MAGKLKKSPLAPKSFPKMPPLAGVRLGATAAGIKYKDRTDVMLMSFAPGTSVAGVLTKSLTASAPVEWCREVLKGGRAAGILVNSGNANAFTGKLGEVAVREVAGAGAQVLGCAPGDLLLASTGVIGEPLPFEKMAAALPKLAKNSREDRWAAAAKAIMTTDTYPKGATRRTRIGGKTVTINGIAKGSGMIAPDMATMLAFVATDAKLPPAVLRSLLREGAERSFNAITVDGDTSTSDTLILAATGQVDHPKVSGAGDKALAAFRRALEDLLVDLAQQVVRDGEGATKFVTLKVGGAASDAAAKRIGLAVANSPLVKTAIAGEDANWGRIVMAVGKAGEKADRDKLAISIGGVRITEKGYRRKNYDEAPVARHMKGKEIEIAIDVGVGKGKATVWTCDLTHGYITINGDYRS